jgi:hypothetical protein
VRFDGALKTARRFIRGVREKPHRSAGARLLHAHANNQTHFAFTHRTRRERNSDASRAREGFSSALREEILKGRGACAFRSLQLVAALLLVAVVVCVCVVPNEAALGLFPLSDCLLVMH